MRVNVQNIEVEDPEVIKKDLIFKKCIKVLNNI